MTKHTFAPLLERAAAQHRAGRLREAEMQARRALSLAPAEPAAWAGLGLAVLQQDRAAEAEQAFARATLLAPDDAELLANHAGVLLRLGQAAKAAQRLRRAAAIAPGVAGLHANLGVALHEAGELEAALDAYDAALRLAPCDARALGARTATLLALGRAASAPALTDWDRLVSAVRLPPPPRYPDLGASNQALADSVTRHPSLMADRPGKTTRRGRQTGELLRDPPAPVTDLAAALEAEVGRYLTRMAAAANTARLVPRPPAWRLTAWATVLEDDGHQDPHNHPSGRVSGVYYVATPAIGDADHAGWIEFGRPHPSVRCPEPAALRLIRPEPGLLVLFPSYAWHRTMPHRGPERRVSIAFDVIAQS